MSSVGKSCHYCGVGDDLAKLTRDHIVPRMMRGPTTSWNLVPACEPCNGQKSHNVLIDHCITCTTAQQTYLGSLHLLAEGVVNTQITAAMLRRWYERHSVHIGEFAGWRKIDGRWERVDDADTI